MTQMDISIPLDNELKERFETLLHEFGYSASAVFGAFVEATVNTRSFPAELHIEQDPFYSKENMERLMKSIERLESGQGTHHELIEVDNEEDMG